MVSLHKGSRDLIRDLNHHLVLTLLRTYAPIAQQEIARLSGLSPATISSIIADLTTDGWIEEVGFGPSTGRRGGRRPVLLRLNARAGLVIGVKMMEHAIVTVITDLDATVLHSAAVSLELPVTSQEYVDPDHVIAALRKAIEAILASSGVNPQHILGIGVGISGLVDAKEGICRVSRIFPGQRDVPLAAILTEHLGLPVSIENDVRARTIAEHAFGPGHNVQHFLLVTIGRGIGSGIVINGQLYRGAVNGAGELGHMCMDENGPLCECGRRGCLEALASTPAIVTQAASAYLAAARKPPDSIEELVEAAQGGDTLAQQLLARAGHLIGLGVANAVNLLSPECIFVVGEGTSAGEWLLEPLRKAMRTHIFPGLNSELVVDVEAKSDEAWARGSACMVISTLFQSPIPA